MKLFLSCLIIFLCFGANVVAHPMPHSILLFDVRANDITAELHWPLKEFQLVYPDEDIDVNPNSLIERKGAWLDAYLHQHMSITDSEGHVWTITILGKKINETQQSFTGPFHELVFDLLIEPPPGVSPRHFIMHYDAIMHQVVTHKMFISVRQDWSRGLYAQDSTSTDVRVLMVNNADYKVSPVIINLDEGSNWKGFKSMVNLGIQHIAEGTDHLLFLLVLLLPAPLLVVNRRWAAFGGTKYGLVRLLKITTSFTIGHSLTLLAGALGWLRPPSQPIEILIAVSILVTAIHAIRPIFPGKEIFIAAGFGLIHGLAFASVIANLHLEAGRMALSILGFNVGIELMQLFIIAIIFPWLLVLSERSIYAWIRIFGAIVAGIAAMAWIAERVSNKPNKMAALTQQAAAQWKWMVLALVAIAIVSYLFPKKKLGNQQ